MNVVNYGWDAYGNMWITFSDGTTIGGAVAEEYARTHGL